MAQSGNSLDCAKICWIVAAITGIILAIVLQMTTHVSLFWTLLFGIVIFFVGGRILRSFFCGTAAVNVVPPVAKAPTPAAKPAPTPPAPAPAIPEVATSAPAAPAEVPAPPPAPACARCSQTGRS